MRPFHDWRHRPSPGSFIRKMRTKNSLETKAEVDMSSETTVFRSRRGFHPCDYQLFLKLKYLHKWYWQTLYDFHRWHRWWRKEEQNRVGPEPAYCPTFVEERTWCKRVRTHGQNGFKVYPRIVVDLGVVSLYQDARMPQAEPVQPLDAATRERIERRYDEVFEYVKT